MKAAAKTSRVQHRLALLGKAKAFFPGFLPLLAFLVVVSLSFGGVNQPGTLGITGGQCGDQVCLDTVFPAGYAWSGNLREGNLVVAVNGGPLPDDLDLIDWRSLRSITVVASDGTTVTATVGSEAISDSEMRWSLWVVAGFFAALGSLVWYRRPDLESAATLGRMTAMASVALAIGPTAGGPALEWALAIQFTALAVLGFAFYDFVFHMVAEQTSRSRIAVAVRWVLGLLTLVSLVGYLLAVAVSSTAYEFIRPLFHTALAAGLLSSVYLLAAAVLRAPSGSNEDRLRVPLLGMLLGVTPFPLATLVPLAAGRDPLAPHLTVLPVILIPSAFAYSILHDQLWGIRRLIHRGLVYALISSMVLGFVIGGIALVNGLLGGTQLASEEIFAVSVVAFLGILAYRPISGGARWLIDRYVYGTTVSYFDFVHGLQRDIANADPERELPDTLNHVLAGHLDLESALLFKRNDETGAMELLSEVGDHSSKVMTAVNEKKIVLPEGTGGDQPIVIPFEGEQILAMELWAAQEHVGTIMLGPKRGGDLFIQDEVNLIANSAPFLGAALERHEMSQTMRHLNQRLIETDETSRQRMAVDLHDGPLQKAVALSIGRVTDPREQQEVANELVNELREIGTRLRPSILDDLGLLSLEWLLAHNMRGTDIDGSLDIELPDPSQRFHPDVEIALFRVTQEAINNAVKHSSATELKVHIERDGNNLVLTIRDNGVGIGGAGSGRIPSSRLGMIGMRERVIQVGGHLEVHSWPGRGVFIRATVPATPPPPVVEAPKETEA